MNQIVHEITKLVIKDLLRLLGSLLLILAVLGGLGSILGMLLWTVLAQF